VYFVDVAYHYNLISERSYLLLQGRDFPLQMSLPGDSPGSRTQGWEWQTSRFEIFYTKPDERNNMQENHYSTELKKEKEDLKRSLRPEELT